MRFLAAGNISIDLIHTEAGTERRVAGSSIYAAVVARRLGAEPYVVARCGRDVELDHLRLLVGNSLSGVVMSESTTSFELIYMGEDRVLRLLSRSEEIPPRSLDNIPNCEVGLASPIYHEIPLDTMREIRRKCGFLGLDPQGCIRLSRGDGTIEFRPAENLDEYILLSDLVSTSRPEIRYLSGRDGIEGLRSLLDRGAPMVLLTREGGSDRYILITEDLTLEASAIPPARMVDPGGAGDASTAAFLVEYSRTKDPLWSLWMASSVSSFVYEEFGVSGAATREKVIERLREFLLRNRPDLYRRFRERLEEISYEA